jgi:large subunit ribosomal protein L15
MSMMHDITAGLASKKHKRKGRGESSGKGKTCGRGTKAAHGGDVAWKPLHEGGQTPLHRRLPKRGFSNDRWENPNYIVNIGELESLEAGATVDAVSLAKSGLIQDTKLPVKILGGGTLSKKLTIKADWYTKSALARIAELGGEALTAKGAKFELPKAKKKFVKRPDKAKSAAAAKPEPAAEGEKK